jgi:hypothetical protein
MIGLAPPGRAHSWQIAAACTDEAAVARLVADAVPKIARGSGCRDSADTGVKREEGNR